MYSHYAPFSHYTDHMCKVWKQGTEARYTYRKENRRLDVIESLLEQQSYVYGGPVRVKLFLDSMVLTGQIILPMEDGCLINKQVYI